MSRASAEMPPGSAARSTGTLPKRTTGGIDAGQAAGRSRTGRPRRAERVDGLLPTAVELGGDLGHAFVPAARPAHSTSSRGGPDLLLECLYFSSSLAEVALGLGRELGHLSVVGLDRLAHLAGLVGLDLDHPLGVDLVDLAEPLVADRLAGGDGTAWFSLACFRSSSWRAARRLRLGSSLARRPGPAVGVQAVGVGERLHERDIEPLELGLGELDEPGAEQAAERQSRDRSRRRARPGSMSDASPAPGRSARTGSMKTQASRAPFIDLGMIRPSRILSGGSIRVRRSKISSTGSSNFEYDSRDGSGGRG